MVELARPRCKSIENMSSIALDSLLSLHMVLMLSAVISVLVSTLVMTVLPSFFTLRTKSRKSFFVTKAAGADFCHASPCSGT